MEIYLGIFILVFGVLFAVFSIPVGIVFFLVGIGAIVYGYVRGGEALEELSIDDVRGEEERRRVELAAEGGVDAEELYSKLLTQYVEHWGVSSGSELLENEITAYTMHGMSFKEAVERVYRRQVKKSHRIL